MIRYRATSPTQGFDVGVPDALGYVATIGNKIEVVRRPPSPPAWRFSAWAWPAPGRGGLPPPRLIQSCPAVGRPVRANRRPTDGGYAGPARRLWPSIDQRLCVGHPAKGLDAGRPVKRDFRRGWVSGGTAWIVAGRANGGLLKPWCKGIRQASHYRRLSRGPPPPGWPCLIFRMISFFAKFTVLHNYKSLYNF